MCDEQTKMVNDQSHCSLLLLLCAVAFDLFFYRCFHTGTIKAWSEPEFNFSPLPLPPLGCVHIILFRSELRCVCIIKAAAVYPCCLVTLVQEKTAKCITLLTSLLVFDT